MSEATGVQQALLFAPNITGVVNLSFLDSSLVVVEGIGPVQLCVLLTLANGIALENSFVASIVADSGIRAGMICGIIAQPQLTQ